MHEDDKRTGADECGRLYIAFGTGRFGARLVLREKIQFFGTIAQLPGSVEKGYDREVDSRLGAAIQSGGSVMGIVRDTSNRLGTIGELFAFFWSNKKWWLLPMIAILFVLGALIALAQSSAIAPFIYTLF